MRIFHDLEPPRPVVHVRLTPPRGVPSPQWYTVTGWTIGGIPCPAVVHKVDDSGEGVILLVSGGDAGLRLKPADSSCAWAFDDPQQWGVPFLLMSDARDVTAT